VAQARNYQIATDSDFSFPVLPDTQYYNSSYSWVFTDQVNWIVVNEEPLIAPSRGANLGHYQVDVGEIGDLCPEPKIPR